MAHAAFHLHCHFDGRQRSPEISPQMVHAAMKQEISRLCVNSTDTTPAIPACSPARDDRAAGGARGNTFPPCTRHPERQRRISVSMVSEGKGSQYQWAGRRVPGPGMTGSRVIHGMYQDSSPGVRMTDGAGRKAGSVFVPPVRNERVFLSPAPSRKPFANSFLSVCIPLFPCRVGNLSQTVSCRFAYHFLTPDRKLLAHGHSKKTAKE